MKPIAVRSALYSAIRNQADSKFLFCRNPDKDFSRHRKLSFQQVIAAVLSFRNGPLNRDLLDFFGLKPDTVSSSAFIQQRSKILPEAFSSLFSCFTASACGNKCYHGLRLLAVDGSDIQIPANSQDPDSFFPGTNGQKPYNLLHINTMYDLIQNVYIDACVQKNKVMDESRALTQMVDRSPIPKAIVIADRNYESYNNLAHIQQKGWFFLIRIRDHSHSGIAHGLSLPSTGEYDVPFNLKLTNRFTNQVKSLFLDRDHYKHISRPGTFDFLPRHFDKLDPPVFFELSFRIVRFRIAPDSFETIITNLDAALFPPAVIKYLYAMRWGIETSFRHLKYTLGLLHLHAKKVDFILQEIFAKLIMYNFCELITQSVVIHQGKRKYIYAVSFTHAVLICREFFLGKLHPPFLEALFMRVLSPIRPGRNFSRKPSQKSSCCFLYRVA